jgi:hypothetical protein
MEDRENEKALFRASVFSAAVANSIEELLAVIKVRSYLH